MSDRFDGAADPSVAISALEHWAYCPRQAALIWIERIFTDDGRTTAGAIAHKHVDTTGGETRRGVHIHRSVPLVSERLGLHGIADTVEFTATGIHPVEHKVGATPPGGPADLQAAAQALCLEEMTGTEVPVAYVYSAATRSRRPFDVAALQPAVRRATTEIRAAMRNGTLPPAVNDQRCRPCSLRYDCMPGVLTGSTRVLASWENLFTVDEP